MLEQPPDRRGTEIRLVDLCAGLGGFHRAVELVSTRLRRGHHPEQPFLMNCVAASELDLELRTVYVRNFPDVVNSYRVHHPPELLADMIDTLDEDLAGALPQYDDDGHLEAVHGDMAVFLADDLETLRLTPDGEALLPEHDLLCAGFPCQPFSKSGFQLGFEDTRGTVFHMIATMLEHRRPPLLLLENVGNFPRHDGGNTWRRVREVLDGLGYDILATEPHSMGPAATGLMSPHHLGYPHHRERFLLVGQLRRLETHAKTSVSPLVERLLSLPLPHRRPFRPPAKGGAGKAARQKAAAVSSAGLQRILSRTRPESSRDSLDDARPSRSQSACAKHWAEFIKQLRMADERRSGTPILKDLQPFLGSMPSFPIWGYELDPWNWYPIDANPRTYLDDWRRLSWVREDMLDRASESILGKTHGLEELRDSPPAGRRGWLEGPLDEGGVARWIQTWPGYAGRRKNWPRWKVRFITQNRAFATLLWSRLDPRWLRSWLDGLYHYEVDGRLVPRAASHQKLEWNCKGCSLDLWEHILQFRPSGLRVKRAEHVPALIAMTTTQVPLASDRITRPAVATPTPSLRYIMVREGLELQGFPADWEVPQPREHAFKALGNAVHAKLIADVLAAWWLDIDGGPDAHRDDQEELETRRRATADRRQLDLPYQ